MLPRPMAFWHGRKKQANKQQNQDTTTIKTQPQTRHNHKQDTTTNKTQHNQNE
jgi:hypothetical protein